MAPVVVLVLALLAPALGLPLATTDYTSQTEGGTPVTNIVSQIQEKTGAPVSTGCSAGYSVPVNQENVAGPVTRVQNAPVNVEQSPQPHTEPLFLPPQPAVPQTEQGVRPVIVPAEAIASGRVIIMAIEPIQQRSFPDVILVPQQQQQQQQTTVPETPVQQFQTVEKQTPFQPNYDVESLTQQNVQTNFNEVPQRQGQVQPTTTQHQNYPQQGAQRVIQVQPVVQQENVEKQAQPGAGYTQVEPVQGLGNTQTNVELQGQRQQVEPLPQEKQTQCATEQTQGEPQERVSVQETVEQVQNSQAESHQQQTYNVQPEQVVQQTQSVEPQQVAQGVHYPVPKTQVQQEYEPHQVDTYTSAQFYNFGDKIPQQQPVDTAVHQYFGQPVVVGGQ